MVQKYVSPYCMNYLEYKLQKLSLNVTGLNVFPIIVHLS